VDTTQPMTVTTQFYTDNTGQNLVEIRRIYTQNGIEIQNSKVNVPGIPPLDSINEKFCNIEKQVFKDPNTFQKLGGLKRMSQSMQNGMVLVMSLWDDYEENMLWLDSQYPLNKPPSNPGVTRGPCSTTSGVPKYVESQYPNAYVKYSNIKFGDIGSTLKI